MLKTKNMPFLPALFIISISISIYWLYHRYEIYITYNHLNMVQITSIRHTKINVTHYDVRSSLSITLYTGIFNKCCCNIKLSPIRTPLNGCGRQFPSRRSYPTPVLLATAFLYINEIALPAMHQKHSISSSPTTFIFFPSR